MTAVLDRPLSGSTRVLPRAYHGHMAVKKLSISLDPETFADARTAAALAGMSLSAWLSNAARDAAKLAIAREALDDYIAEYGEPDPETVERANAELAAAGFFEPETAEHARARARALARLDGITEDIE